MRTHTARTCSPTSSPIYAGAATRTRRPSIKTSWRASFTRPPAAACISPTCAASEGELGLKASGSDDYFGLIYVGDTSRFKNLVAANAPNIVVEEDAISGSLFDGIGEPDTTIETLIGARRFIEGWNSWRVSNMGLLNIGRSEGSQIIQLFGRGVRLRGRDMSLKRTSALDGDHPSHVGLLETLNIFAVRANYMAQFRDYLEREGIATEKPEELPLFIRPNPDFLNKGLLIPQVDDGRDFAAEAQLALERDPGVGAVRVDVAARVHSLASADVGLSGAEASSGRERPIPPRDARDAGLGQGVSRAHGLQGAEGVFATWRYARANCGR